MSRVFAISDLHLEHAENRALLDSAGRFEGAALLVPGDVCSSLESFGWAMNELRRRFDLVIWAPGNHELRRAPGAQEPSGLARYEALVEICRAAGVQTPEDPFPTWPTAAGERRLVSLFLFYDYSFAPAHVGEDEAVRWAMAQGVITPDVALIDPTPYASIPDWCRARCAESLDRLVALPQDGKAIFLNHFPLRSSLLRLKPPSAFAIWCGTRETEAWPLASWGRTAVYGHLHWRSRDVVDGVEHVEVSLGYPHERQRSGKFTDFLQLIA